MLLSSSSSEASPCEWSASFLTIITVVGMLYLFPRPRLGEKQETARLSHRSLSCLWVIRRNHLGCGYTLRPVNEGLCCSISVSHLDITALIRRIKPISKSEKTDDGVLGARCHSTLMTRLQRVVPSLSLRGLNTGWPRPPGHLLASDELRCDAVLQSEPCTWCVCLFLSRVQKMEGLSQMYCKSIHTHKHTAAAAAGAVLEFGSSSYGTHNCSCSCPNSSVFYSLKPSSALAVTFTNSLSFLFFNPFLPFFFCSQPL